MFTYLHCYLPETWAAQERAGLINANAGIRFCQSIDIEEHLKFNRLAARDGELFALLREAYGKTPAVADMNRLRAEFGRFLCPMAAQTQLDRRMLRNLAERLLCRTGPLSDFQHPGMLFSKNPRLCQRILKQHAGKHKKYA